MSSQAAVIGHRGWPDRYPDNTLAGFVAALDHVDFLELDVRRSADGKLVLAHDPTVGGIEVAGTPWPVLAEIDLGEGNRPALLDEVLLSISGCPAHIEVKNDPMEPGYEPDHRLALEAAARARPGDFVTSAFWPTADLVRKTFPDVPTGLVVLRAFDPPSAVVHALDAGHTLLVPNHHHVDETFMSLAGDLMVTPWTVNDPVRAEELVQMGVSGIITDRPDVIAEVVRS